MELKLKPRCFYEKLAMKTTLLAELDALQDEVGKYKDLREARSGKHSPLRVYLDAFVKLCVTKGEIVTAAALRYNAKGIGIVVGQNDHTLPSYTMATTSTPALPTPFGIRFDDGSSTILPRKRRIIKHLIERTLDNQSISWSEHVSYLQGMLVDWFSIYTSDYVHLPPGAENYLDLRLCLFVFFHSVDKIRARFMYGVEKRNFVEVIDLELDSAYVATFTQHEQDLYETDSMTQRSRIPQTISSCGAASSDPGTLRHEARRGYHPQVQESFGIAQQETL